MRDFSAIVVSVVLLLEKMPKSLSLKNLSQALADSFEYYELVVVLNPWDGIETIIEQIMTFPNTRCIVMNADAPEDVLRKKAFESVIGDQIVFWNAAEAPASVISDLIQSNIDGHDFTGIEYNKQTMSFYSLCSSVFTCVLNRITAYSINGRLSSVGCYSRTLVNAINAHGPETGYMRLTLASMGFRHVYLKGATPTPRSLKHTIKRISGSLEIIGSVPHKLLLATAWASLGSVAACVFYFLYTCCIWLFAPAVQPGWITTSIILSIFFAILFFAVFVFSCIFLTRMKIEMQDRFTIARESSRSDFLENFSTLNITDKEHE